jgi:hypothetical protein
MRANADRLVSFYAGVAPNDSGWYLHDIHIWPDERLERTHDYIQWLFPLRERSGFNMTAPTLDDAASAEFLARAELREKLRTSFVRMLLFYGFTPKDGPPLRVVRASSCGERAEVWLSWMNHNHLRITRILKSLKLLGLGEEAEAFFGCLRELYKEEEARPRISPEAIRRGACRACSRQIAANRLGMIFDFIRLYPRCCPGGPK